MAGNANHPATSCIRHPMGIVEDAENPVSEEIPSHPMNKKSGQR
jgi:hypothetical protein